MRGRTNIPPRVGGIVNGVVREYIASGEIKIGDYVQLVANNSSYLLYEQKSFIVDGKNTGVYPVKTIKKANTKMSHSDTEMYVLSNGKGVLFFYDEVSFQFDILVFSISDGKIVKKEYYLPYDMSSYNIATYKSVVDRQFIIELSENSFLYVCYSRKFEDSDTYFPVGIATIEYNEISDTFSISDVSFEYDVDYSFVGYAAYEIRSDVFVFVCEDKILCGTYNRDTRTFEMRSKINSPSSSESFSSVLGIYSGKLVVYTNKGNCKTLSVDSSYNILTEKSVNLTNFYRYFHVYENKFVSFSITNITNTDSYVSFKIKGYLFTVSNTGDVSLVFTSEVKECKIYGSNLYNSGENFSVEYLYKNGKIFFEIFKASSYSYSGQTRYLEYRTFIAEMNCNVGENEITFGDISSFFVNKEYSTTYLHQKGKWNIYPVELNEENGIVIYSCTTTNYSNTNRIYAVKPGFSGFENLFGNSIVKKYETKLSGIAKTNAANGETVQVYSPE